MLECANQKVKKNTNYYKLGERNWLIVLFQGQLVARTWFATSSREVFYNSFCLMHRSLFTYSRIKAPIGTSPVATRTPIGQPLNAKRKLKIQIEILLWLSVESGFHLPGGRFINFTEFLKAFLRTWITCVNNSSYLQDINTY